MQGAVQNGLWKKTAKRDLLATTENSSKQLLAEAPRIFFDCHEELSGIQIKTDVNYFFSFLLKKLWAGNNLEDHSSTSMAFDNLDVPCKMKMVNPPPQLTGPLSSFWFAFLACPEAPYMGGGGAPIPFCPLYKKSKQEIKFKKSSKNQHFEKMTYQRSSTQQASGLESGLSLCCIILSQHHTGSHVSQHSLYVCTTLG